MIDFSLEGKIALITGASSGIGEAVAMMLSEYGAYCMLVGRNIDDLHIVVEKIMRAGGKAGAIACNIGQIKQIESLFKELKNRFGKLDILVVHPEHHPYLGDIANATENDWDLNQEINLRGPFFVIQKASELMSEAGKGSVVVIASATGVRTVELQSLYAITNAGLIAMTKAYAKELASKNIRVNALLPGITEADFLKKLMKNKTVYNALLKKIPMNRNAHPYEMTGAVLYLVSEAASFTTGACITCDGGFLIA